MEIKPVGQNSRRSHLSSTCACCSNESAEFAIEDLTISQNNARSGNDAAQPRARGELNVADDEIPTEFWTILVSVT